MAKAPALPSGSPGIGREHAVEGVYATEEHLAENSWCMLGAEAAIRPAMQVVGVPRARHETHFAEIHTRPNFGCVVARQVRRHTQAVEERHRSIGASALQPEATAVACRCLGPLGGVGMRRAAVKRGLHAFLLVLVLAGVGAMMGLTSCGGQNSGYLANNQKTYTVTVTATSGSVSHSTNVYLTVK